MNERKGIKRIMLFYLLLYLFPVYSFGKAEAVQAAALKSTEAFQGGTCK